MTKTKAENLKPALTKAKVDDEEAILKATTTMNWFRKRHLSTTKDQYIKSTEEVMKDDEIEIMFKKIDYDKSGKIDILELQDLFVKNGMIMSEDEIRTFFESCQTVEYGFLNFEEFKALQRNHKIDALYRKYAIRSRQAHEKRFL